MGVSVAEREPVTVPRTLEEAIEPAWLERALAPLSGGAPIAHVEVVDVFTTMASKVRVAVSFADRPDVVHAVCLKAFLGWDEDRTTIREADFYTEIAPHLTMRVPRCINTVIDRDAKRGMLIMEDLIVAGVRFCSALEPFTVDQAAASLDQIARLHVASHLLPGLPRVPSRIGDLAAQHHFPVEDVQRLLDDPRGIPLEARTRDASLLYRAIETLAERTVPGPQTLLHGDCHAGNLYMTADGPGFTDWQLIQHGLWAFDVAYHINAILPVEVAEREERRLVDHYLDAVRAHGGEPPAAEQAWRDYRLAQPYGFYHWAITRRVDPAITNVFTERLGKGVERHGSYALLGL